MAALNQCISFSTHYKIKHNFDVCGKFLENRPEGFSTIFNSMGRQSRLSSFSVIYLITFDRCCLQYKEKTSQKLNGGFK